MAPGGSTPTSNGGRASGWTSPVQRRGLSTERGGAYGRGRGRGGPLVLQDMTTMALDYSNKVNLIDVSGPSTSSTFNTSELQEHPRQASALPAPRSFRKFNAVDTGRSNMATSASPSQSPHHASTVIASRRPLEQASLDPSLTIPMSFVKASQIIKPTMNAEEHDRLLAQQRLEDLFARAASTVSAPLPVSDIAAASTPEKEGNSEKMSRMIPAASSGSKRSSASQPLSPHARPFEKPSFLGLFAPSLRQRSSPHSSEAEISKMSTTPGQELGQEIIPDTRLDFPGFVIDKVGKEHSDDDVVVEKPLIPDRDIILRPPSRTGQEEIADDEDMSDTEELYPRSFPPVSKEIATAAYPSTSHVPPLSSDKPSLPIKSYPPHIPIQPYARVITEDVPHPRIVLPFIPKLSAEAQEFVSSATSTSAASNLVPSKKAAKKAQLKAIKERKKDRKRSVRPSKQKKVPRMDDSDLEWGSDGPPKIVIDDEDNVKHCVNAIEQTLINASPGKGRKGSSRYSKKTAVDLAMEDYLMKISVRQEGSRDPTGSSDSEAPTGMNDLAQLRNFVSSMSASTEHLNIDDLNDIAEMRDENSTDVDSLDSERLRKEINGQTNFPIYQPAPPDWVSDPNDERNKIFKSDDEEDMGENPQLLDAWAEAGKRLMQDTSKEVSTDSDENEERQEIALEKGKPVDNDEQSDKDEDDESDSEDASADDLIMAKEEKYDILVVSDDDEDDESFLASRPARRNRQQPKFGSDIFDELLQSQWIKDREKKAIRRQERALKRLEAKPNKSNAKRAKRASLKAKAYREEESAGDTDIDLRLSGGKVPAFHRINDDLKYFIEHSGHGEYEVPPMDKKFRYAIHMLAGAYNLKSKSRGNGRDRHNVLYRTQHTSVRGADYRKISKYLSITSTWSMGGDKTYSYDRAPNRKPGGVGAGGQVSRNHEGAVVGEGAEKIASNNIGHKMLAKMGWTEGMQIGRTGGISEPISAVVKTSKAGLGSGWIRYNRGVSTPDVDGGDL